MLGKTVMRGTNRLMFLLLAATLGLAACTPARVTKNINDPFELDNRKTHEANKRLDRTLLKPVSHLYGKATSNSMSDGVDNFASNLALPGMIVNDLLQLNLPDATSNTFRFALNTTFGLGGLFDVAGKNKIPEKSTDFGETLYTWGMPEGRYLELPFIGPSTERATAGMIVDTFLDPVNRLVPAPQKYVATAAYVMKKVGERDKFGAMIDSILYDSADSYAQARLMYLQARRHKLTGGISLDQLEDPYAN